MEVLSEKGQDLAMGLSSAPLGQSLTVTLTDPQPTLLPEDNLKQVKNNDTKCSKHPGPFHNERLSDTRYHIKTQSNVEFKLKMKSLKRNKRL
ncbi:Dual Specificity Protein Phosphatase 16 [Manis pentadactyla]|nr:Dual Specificity Protein Phosphatase 16 [Manis pentadactyla]